MNVKHARLFVATLLVMMAVGVSNFGDRAASVRAQSTATCADKFADRLVGYWSFDDPQHPMQPTVGTLQGTSVGNLPAAPGIVGQALTFNGDAYVNYGAGLDIPAWRNYTVSIWFLNDGRVAPVKGYGQKIIDKTTWFSDFFLGVPNSPDQATPRPVVFMYDRDFKNIQTTGYDYRDSQWHHAVIVKRGVHGELWVDGRLIGEKEDVNPTINNQPLLLGYSLAEDGFQRLYWGGYLDEFAVFRAALSYQEVLELYQLSAAGQSYCLTDRTLTVNTTADPGDGLCTQTECTLREAIALANRFAGENTIAFHIPGAGPHTIQPVGDLPAITDRAIIDGYTQPGAQPNTNPLGEPINAIIKVEIDGSRATSGFTFTGNSWNSTIRGLAINRFRAMAISESRRTVITGNFIGADPQGVEARGNGFGIQSGGGVGGTTPQIGGATPADRNLIVGNSTGIEIGPISYAIVEGNFIGADVTGSNALGNKIGVVAYSCPGCEPGRLTLRNNLIAGNETGIRVNYLLSIIGGNLVGTDRTGQGPLPNTGNGALLIGNDINFGGNTVAYNGGNGIRVEEIVGINAISIGNNRIFANGAAGISIIGNRAFAHLYANRIYANGALGIDLGADGVTINDPGDGDSGPNRMQNYPELRLAGSDQSSSVIHGVINSTPNRVLTIAFYANQACDSSGYGEGEFVLAEQQVTTNSSGQAAFTVNLPQAIPLGHALTATATDLVNLTGWDERATSEFARCQPVAGVINSYLRAVATTTHYNPTPAPNAPAGIFTIRATFVNQSDGELSGLFLKVQRLTNNNRLLNAEGGVGGVGAVVAAPNPLPAGAQVTLIFRIGLQERAPFTFLVDSYGAPTTAVTTALDPAQAGFTYIPVADELASQTGQGEVTYLPLVSR